MYDNQRPAESVKKKNRCACCLKPFFIERRENCSDCQANTCFLCHKNTKCLEINENCLETLGGFSELSEASIEFNTTKVEHVQNDLESAAVGEKEENSMETVRDKDEKIIEDLIEISLNNTPINRIYDHSVYKTTTNTASMAQMALRELVERVVEEAKMLPGLKSSKSEKEKEEKSSFEDLLATAILNKVIEKFQNDYVDGNRNVLSEKSPNKCKNSEIETSFEKGQEHLSLTIEERIEEVDEENDIDFPNTRRVPFPEYGMDIVSQDLSDECQEDSNIHDLVTPIESWEENWLFQKKKMQIRSDPVSMLVPYPSEDYRALIGDQNVEDIPSDDEIEHELKFVISSVTESSNTERTKNKIECSTIFKNSPVLENIIENGIDKNEDFESKKKDNFPCNKEDNFEFEIEDHFKCEKENNFECKQEERVFDEKNETEEMSAEDQVQQESEYTEHFDTATQKHMDSLTKIYGPMGIDEVDNETSQKNYEISENLRKCRDSAAFIKGEQTENEIDDDVKLATPPRPGTIAEREHRKWENARPIKNNPYSKKNIQKRLLERQYNCYSIITEGNISKSSEKPLKIILGAKNVDFKRFARDYYINDAITSNEEKQKELETKQHSNTENDIINYDSNSLEDESKMLNCQKNNEETLSRSTSEIQTPSSENWKNSNVEKLLLEKERRNNKNEINARFNNKDSINICDNINNNETSAKSSQQQRVVNKLDLKSFGYECGLRRTQSIQLDSRNHSQEKPKIIRENKNEFQSEINNQEDNFNYPMSGIFHAKSVPNIADIDFSNDDEKQNSNRKKIFLNSMENISIENSQDIPILPSVRKLAKAFSKSTEINPLMMKKEKKRPTTPEIHLVERPIEFEKKTYENQSNTEDNRKSLIGDISIISPGKLKNNIQFWEKLQKQS
ncbi:GRIP and coiled-coil domain-containing protein-like isoform X2 [Leptopilina boulardi]|uniref:GRIP and coiled-coil domain-containing protein-like isoform X2 n=1 Tax=Leptopilina boulardi TaxID=63433 RepID=UPI0021F5756E|nr:GRIP and coiled-coil domain-containing protein-like isoform X2 [Leptopilina boulardi]